MDAHAAELMARIQELPDEKKDHFKLTLVYIMHCYLDDEVAGALVVNHYKENRSTIVALGMSEEDFLDDMRILIDAMSTPDPSLPVQ